ncbi:Na/Pi symporter [archaeon]|nr:Na/Pi symporter [archaeon]
MKLLGSDIVQGMIESTSDPLTALFVGILATSIIQSSSATTCIVVSIVSVNPAFMINAIPIVMGANIGTTVTNTLVSFGHVVRKKEFEKALGGATLHDFFNLIAVLILFPLELLFHPLQHASRFMAESFEGAGGFTFISPLKLIIKPAVTLITDSSVFLGDDLTRGIALLVLALIVLVLSLRSIVQIMRKLALNTEENVVSKYIFRNSTTAFAAGLVLTAIIQSSSVTTSLIVPFIGAGMLSLEQVLPYMMGANIGTTITSLLAGLGGTIAGGKDAAISGLQIACVHSLFNIAAVCLIYPIRKIPLTLARTFGKIGSIKTIYAVAFVVIVFYIIPIAYIILTKYIIPYLGG